MKMKQLTLGLIAHDSKKKDMVSLIKTHREELALISLVATKNTGRLLQAELGLDVTLAQSGPNGGDLQIGALVANGDVRGVIFLRDPLTAQTFEPEINSLLRVCDIQGIPMATNLAAGEAIIHLMAEHPEALSGHHIAAQYLEDVANIHD